MHRIIKLDEKISSLFENFSSVVRELQMDLVCNLSDEETIALQSYPGIYRIDVCTLGESQNLTDWIENFRLEWEHADFLRKFTPNFKKKRIAQHHKINEWMPIYLGKSKNVGKRVLEHINLGLEKSTFALKLKARPSMEKKVFQLYTLKLPVHNYNIIAPALEAELRNKFHPLIGKQ